MNTTRDYDEAIAGWLHEQAAGRAPAYLDEVLSATVATRQRPWWASIRTWLPALPIGAAPSRRAARLVVIVALVGVLVAAALSFGSRRSLPPPFGLAGNGVLLYDTADGDLAAFDVVTGETTTVLGEAGWDETPDFSPDGTKLVFARRSETPGRWQLLVADADGGNIRELTPPINPTWSAWSPDASRVAVVDSAQRPSTMAIYFLDGQAPLPLAVDGRVPMRAAFRPDGREIVYQGFENGLTGVYAVAASGELPSRVLVPAAGGNTVSFATLSPDGTKVAYTRWEDDHAVIHVVGVDSEVDEVLHIDPASDGEDLIAWSPDGSRLLFQRHVEGVSVLAVGALHGSDIRLVGPEFPDGSGGAEGVFSPDGQQVIVRYEHDGSHWLLETSGGPGTQLDLPDSAAVSWQRVAP